MRLDFKIRFSSDSYAEDVLIRKYLDMTNSLYRNIYLFEML